MESRVSKMRGNKEFFAMYADCLVQAHNDLINSFAIVRDVAKKFDGKILNARFENALREQTDSQKAGVRFSINWRSYANGREMVFYVDKRYFTIESGCVYIDSDLGKMISYNVERDFLNEEGRLVYERLDNLLTSLELKHKEEIERWSDAKNNYDEYKRKLHEALCDFGEKIKDINSLFKPYEIRSYDWENAKNNI